MHTPTIRYNRQHPGSAMCYRMLMILTIGWIWTNNRLSLVSKWTLLFSYFHMGQVITASIICFEEHADMSSMSLMEAADVHLKC